MRFHKCEVSDFNHNSGDAVSVAAGIVSRGILTGNLPAQLAPVKGGLVEFESLDEYEAWRKKGSVLMLKTFEY